MRDTKYSIYDIYWIQVSSKDLISSAFKVNGSEYICHDKWIVMYKATLEIFEYCQVFLRMCNVKQKVQRNPSKLCLLVFSSVSYSDAFYYTAVWVM